jgi:taurine dioxygenase
MPHTISTLSSALGAEVVGVDVSEIGDNLFGELHQVSLDHDGVMVIRDQHLTPEAYLNFGRRFGELLLPNLTQMPGYPEIYHYQIPVEEKLMPRAAVRNGSVWHAAHTYESRLSGASIVHVVELPPRGGDMFFANMYASYEALSDPMQRLLGELSGRVHPSRVGAEGAPRQSRLRHRNPRSHPERERCPTPLPQRTLLTA